MAGVPGKSYSRILALGAIFTLCMAVLLCRLWFVQVYRHGSFEKETSGQSIRRIRTLPVRGRILARDGSILVDNQVSYDLVFHPSEMRQSGHRSNTVEHIMETAGELANLIDRDPSFGEDYVQRRLNVYPALPLLVFSDLSETEMARLVELPKSIRGMELTHSIKRSYPYPGIATHLLGFCGRAKPPMEEDSDLFSYVPLQLRGRQGLERYYDSELAGIGGMKVVRVNTLGYVYEEIGEGFDAIPGLNLQLTLDLEAQRIADALLKNKSGAIVVLDVKRGGVLAMASSPTYDLSRLTQNRYSRMAKDEERRPLFNRALAGGYLPGSIIKPLIGLAALEAGVLDEDDEYNCTGKYYVAEGTRPIRCWQRHGHGLLNVVEAIERSCNPFFNHYGVETGLSEIRPLLLSAGLGRRPGIDLPSVGAAGLVPSRDWARRYFSRSWLAIDTAYISMGQGSIHLSPLQAAMFTAAIANGGTVFRPHLVRKIIDSEGGIRESTHLRAVSRLAASRENLDLIREGMYRAVNRSHGTARNARNNVVSLAGKTGTAQVINPDESYSDTWFIGFGPVEDPQWAIAILIERGASGGSTAAPLAAEFFKKWKGD